MERYLSLRVTCAVLIGTCLPLRVLAGTFQTLYTFTGGADGAVPNSALVPGPNGSFIGTTSYGGSGANYSGYGTVFQLSPPAKGQSLWTLATLHSFTGVDGGYPFGLTADAAGNVYGTSQVGGTFNGTCLSESGTDIGCGTIYELSPPKSGGTAWQFNTIYAFSNSGDGANPTYGLTIDSTGSLYGVTPESGIVSSSCTYFGSSTTGCGTVFKLAPPGSGQTAWAETTLYEFIGGKDGFTPNGPLLLGSSGVIYGSTHFGGNITSRDCAAQIGCGTIFQLAPPAPGKSKWIKSTISALKGSNGSQPVGGLTMDGAGDIFGNGQNGGKLADCTPGAPYPNGCGVAIQLSPPSQGSTDWSTRTLYSFRDGIDGSFPWDPPIAVGKSYYMTTSGDEVKNYGSIVDLTPPVAGKTVWKERTVFTFSNDANSSNPWSELLPARGVLYGTAAGDGGPAPWGTVFSFKP